MKIEKTALVIDDNRLVADQICSLLSLLGIQAKPIYGSRTALLTLREETPAMIFLDINLPGVTGYDILGYVTREPRLENVPVYIVSVDDQQETINRAIAGGARAYLTKPISLKALEDVLKTDNFIEELT